MQLVEAIPVIAKYAREDKTIQGLEMVQIRDGEVIAHDLRGGAYARVDDADGMDLAVNAQRTVQALKLCGPNPTFKVTDSGLLIKSSAGEFRIAVQKLGDIPELHRPPQDASWHTVPADDFGAFSRVGWARGKEASRPHLTGIYIQGKAVFAISGHCMCRWNTDTDLQQELKAKDDICITPDTLFGADGDVEICASGGKGGHFFVRSGAITRVAPRMGHTLPEFGQVLADVEETPSITVNRADLQAALRRATATNNAKEPCIVFELNEGLLVRTEDDSRLFGFAHTITPVAKDPFAGQGMVSFNGRYMVGALDACTDETVKLTALWTPAGALSPIGIIGDRMTGVIMPMRT